MRELSLFIQQYACTCTRTLLYAVYVHHGVEYGNPTC